MAHRVIVWGTGNVGQAALRAVLADPALVLAGVVVSDPSKVGRDAGDLCGRPPVGVVATADVMRAFAAGADAVAYCASGDFHPDAALDDVERCLRVEHVTRISEDVAPDWPRVSGGSAHGVRIVGRPSLTVTVEAEDEHGDRAGGGNATAASRIVHAIPFACAAVPGILDALAVPLPYGRGLLRV